MYLVHPQPLFVWLSFVSQLSDKTNINYITSTYTKAEL